LIDALPAFGLLERIILGALPRFALLERILLFDMCSRAQRGEAMTHADHPSCPDLIRASIP
jgi:hypothetical protein